MKDISTEDLIKELENRGYKWGNVSGHGQEEYCTWYDNDKDEIFVIADVEKTDVLIKPEDLYKEPIDYDKIW